MAQLQLVMMSGDYVRRSVSVLNEPISIGRSPNNDFVISEDTVSWHHAIVWMEGTQAWVKDLASSNGTYLNNQFIEGRNRVRIGDKLKMGEYIELVVRGDASGWVPWRRALALTDEESGYEHILTSDRMTIGTHEDCDVLLAVGPDLAATLCVHGNGEMWLCTNLRVERLMPDRLFRIAGRPFVIKELDPSQYPTAEYREGRYGTRITVTRKGTAARVEDPRAGAVRDLAGSRASLVRVLAQGFHEVAPMVAEERGWMSLREISTLLWQRYEGGQTDVQVLTYRLQRSLAHAGIDPWCVEQRVGYVRLRASEVWVGPIPE